MTTIGVSNEHAIFLTLIWSIFNYLENQLDSDNDEEQKKAEEKKVEADKWNEDKVDPEAIKKQKDAEKKAEEEKRQANAREKNKNLMFDPDAAFKKR